MTKAIVVVAHGGPEVLEYQDWPVGEPGPGQLRIRQHAIGVNFVDVYQRTGLYPTNPPFVAGNEGAGEVIAIGEGVTEFKPGDRVVYQGTPGAYAEERLMPAAKAVPLPAGISFEQGAAIMLKGGTAYYLLHRTFAVKPGQTILFHAAAGGVGLIACQWAKAIGATVIGTAGSDEKLALARANGCDHAINYRTENFAERVKEITDGKGVDVVYDGNGQATFEASLDCLKPLGMMVSYGNASGPVSIPDLGILARKGSLFLTRPTTAAYFARREDLLEGAASLFAAVEAGTVKVHIGQRFPLKDAAEAHRALEGRKTVGSTVLLP
ncbi:MAG TPA: quinone oxidoreductase [Devosiaceae bacterium]|nr:quinone oxidoreductase [Devosiaceae bacterium]